MAHHNVPKLVLPPMYSGANIIYQNLVKQGVDRAFIYSGGNVMSLIDQFADGQIKYTISANETLGCHAATGYAKATGKPGVYVATSGPGITNCITPMLDAQNDSTPLVVLSGNVKKSAKDTLAFQEAPAISLTDEITKWSYYCDEHTRLENVMDEAFRVATTGKPGVVHIDVPSCVLAEKGFLDNQSQQDIYQQDSIIEIDCAQEKRFQSRKYAELNLDILCETLETCQKPVLFVGQGCLDSSHLVRYLVEETGLPTTTTLHAMGIIDEKSPYALQMCGMHGSVAANLAIQNADCIIGIGTRFDDRTVGAFEKYAPAAYRAFQQGRGGIFSINIDVSDVKTIQPHYFIECSAQEALQKIGSYVKDSPTNFIEKFNPWRQDIAQWQKNHPFSYSPASKPDGLKTQTVVECLSSLINKDTVVTTGVGNHQMMAAQFIKWKHPRQIITSGSMGVMGTALPYAVGAQIANLDDPHSKQIICLDGDGSFNMSLHDLKTVAEYNLPIKIIVLNDGCLSMVKAWEKLYYGERYVATTLNHNPNYRKLAKAFGIPPLYCYQESNLRQNLELMLSQKGPVLLEVKVEGDVCLPLVGPGKALDEMIHHEIMIQG
jgi:acetolactate synthase-1/2/3 large subunit